MEINANNPVSNQVQGLETTPRVDAVKPEKDKATGQEATQAEENPDYRVSLSEMAKQNIAELTNPLEATQGKTESGLFEQEAAQLSQQTAAQLSQTNIGIANQAMQKAVDLFT
jgi:hypothetical protein